MKHNVVARFDRRACCASAPGSDCGSADTRGRPFGRVEFDAASRGFQGYDANYAKGGPHRFLSGNLKPNIYYKAQDFALWAHGARGRRGLSRADFQVTDAAGDEVELVGLEVNIEPGMTEMSFAPEIAVYGGFSFDEPIGWAVEDASCGR
jgi:D-alanine-D-alanine ligase